MLGAGGTFGRTRVHLAWGGQVGTSSRFFSLFCSPSFLLFFQFACFCVVFHCSFFHPLLFVALGRRWTRSQEVSAVDHHGPSRFIADQRPAGFVGRQRTTSRGWVLTRHGRLRIGIETTVVRMDNTDFRGHRLLGSDRTVSSKARPKCQKQSRRTTGPGAKCQTRIALWGRLCTNRAAIAKTLLHLTFNTSGEI